MPPTVAFFSTPVGRVWQNAASASANVASSLTRIESRGVAGSPGGYPEAVNWCGFAPVVREFRRPDWGRALLLLRVQLGLRRFGRLARDLQLRFGSLNPGIGLHHLLQLLRGLSVQVRRAFEIAALVLGLAEIVESHSYAGVHKSAGLRIGLGHLFKLMVRLDRLLRLAGLRLAVAFVVNPIRVLLQGGAIDMREVARGAIELSERIFACGQIRVRFTGDFHLLRRKSVDYGREVRDQHTVLAAFGCGRVLQRAGNEADARVAGLDQPIARVHLPRQIAGAQLFEKLVRRGAGLDRKR